MTIRNKPKKPISFFKTYIIVFSALLAVIAVGLIILWLAMADMEKYTPTTKLKPIINSISENNADALLGMDILSLSEFETEESFSKYLSSFEKDSEITYTRKIVADENKYVYVLKSNDEKIGAVTLEKTGKKSTFGNEEFKVTAFDDFGNANEKVKITAPVDAKVFINGVEIKQSYQTKTGIEIIELEYVPESVPKKTLVEYEIAGLLGDYVITAQGYQGNDLQVAETEVDGAKEYSIGYDGVKEDAAQYDEHIIEVSQAFAKHVTDDLSFTGIAKYISSDSPIYETIRRTEFYWYTEHDKYEFKDIKTLDFKQYSDNCISYRIQFDHFVYRIAANVTSHKECDYTFVFVKEDDEWVVYDMTINS